MDEDQFELAAVLAESLVAKEQKRLELERPIQPPDFDGCCVKCGDDIPEERILFGAITCVPCQTRHEKLSSMTYRRS